MKKVAFWTTMMVLVLISGAEPCHDCKFPKARPVVDKDIGL